MPARVLVADYGSGSELGLQLREILESCPGVDVRFCRQSSDDSCTALGQDGLLSLIDSFQPQACFLALGRLSVKRNRSLLQCFRRSAPGRPLLVALQAGKPQEVMSLLQDGAADFILPPFNPLEVLTRFQRYMTSSAQTDQVVRDLKVKLGLKQLVGSSRAFVGVIGKIPQIAACSANLLISGETGTGKELCARAVHYLSARADQPFVPVNCGAIPRELIENELFGHERAAFTGASEAAQGLVQEAEGGTLFLDEIDGLSQAAQVALLRFLQEKEYRRLGSSRLRRSDVRIVSATNADLDEALEAGRIREDLFYRLNIIPMKLPSLCERRDDIPLLARHFLAKHARQAGRPQMELAADALQALLLHDWPGNVRELEHVIERAVVLSDHTVLCAADIQMLRRTNTFTGQESFREAKAMVVSRFEQSYIQGLLRAHQGNISRAARAAKKNRRAFWELIRKHRIDPDRFRPDGA